MKQCMIWRDRHDKETFYIGMKWKDGLCSQYVSCFLDGIMECFGITKEQVEYITEEPQPIKIVIWFPDMPEVQE